MTRRELIDLYLSLDDWIRTSSVIEKTQSTYSVSDPVCETIEMKERILEILRTQELHTL